ncbi:AraC family transcriptional regulator [Pseudomonas profundi]|uniref:AraC family transcriptional regulator n=1 Tax=Pseudomonas profundi TaxID=1981513 RepID=UPI00123BA76F|nr:helix-turn-helix transcriptional regulator [Pseudomonas profundi]
MSRNGQSGLTPRAIPALTALPRPLFARVESLKAGTTTEWHSHPWAQLSYAIRGVLSVHTETGRFLAPPQRAILIPPELPHAVISSPATEMRSLYLDSQAIPWAPAHCKVLEITPLTRELINHFGQIPPEYDEQGPHGRIAGVLLDQLQAAPETRLYLPWPADQQLQRVCEALYAAPDLPHTLGQWGATAGLSEKTLTRRFLQETGFTFRAWRQRLRLLSALPLLEQRQRITDVALACGYDSTSAFIAAFRKQTGLTPGEFLGTDIATPPQPASALNSGKGSASR